MSRVGRGATRKPLEFVVRAKYDYGEGGYGDGGYGNAYGELLTYIRDATLGTTEIYDTWGETVVSADHGEMMASEPSHYPCATTATKPGTTVNRS